MYQKTYAVKLTGVNDILLHKDNIQWGERVKIWSKEPANKAVSVAGDDRSPAWTWLGCCYDEIGKDYMVIDADCIMSMLRDGGKKCPAPNGKGSMKAQTQSGIIMLEIAWPLLTNGKEINLKSLMNGLHNELDFSKHEESAKAEGFELFVKRAKIGANKHVRVRPRIRNWSASGRLIVVDPQITTTMLQNILTFGGRFCGLGDWRPGSPKSPGQFGTFTAEVEEIKD